MSKKYDFSGWATQNDIQCSDGRIIKKDAFVGNDKTEVPLVWQHAVSSVSNVLGHALLENRDSGVYAYCTFNETPDGLHAKELVKHGDIKSLSIYANKLVQKGNDVVHGCIKELSLVVAPANPGAYIDNVMIHSDEDSVTVDYEKAVIYNDSQILVHSEDDDEENVDEPEEESKEEATEDEQSEESDDENQNGAEEPEEGEMAHSDDDTEEDISIQEVYDSMNPEQKVATQILIAKAVEDAEQNGGKESMAHTNLFEGQEAQDNVLSHSEIMEIVGEAKKSGSLKDTVLAHSISDVDCLFPDAKTINKEPDFIKRDTGWVGQVMRKVHKSPFSRVKSIHANITADAARAKGYIKGEEKTDEVFTLLKRTTTPQTIYKTQKLDRDDVIDITDFNVVSFVKTEMRMMLDEEIARAILIGDGRSTSSDDKINEANIRPIYTDADLYTIKKRVVFSATETEGGKAKKFVQACIRARKDYKGSGNAALYTTEDVLTECLLLEDNNGRVIYDSVEKLATALRVTEIIPVPVMEGTSRTVTENSASVTLDLMGIIVNLTDYNVGADKGGAVSMFEDFDIDFNKQKYLIETRCSGAMTKPYGAIVVESQTLAASEG